jgi:hypothetical protein
VRRYGKTDANHSEIVAAFRKLGCSVLSLAPLGRGAPDLAVGYGGITALVEVKDGGKPRSAQKLTPDQREFWDTWKGGVRLVNGLDAVVETVELLKRWRDRL